MSPETEKLRATLRELESELRDIPSLDSDARTLLEQAAREISVALQQVPAAPAAVESSVVESTDSETLGERLNAAARRFETSHPALSGILERIADGLAQLGI